MCNDSNCTVHELWSDVIVEKKLEWKTEREDPKMKQQIFETIDKKKETLWEMADFIFDHPEYRGKEYQTVGTGVRIP